LNWGLYVACAGGYRELAEMIIEKGGDSNSCRIKVHCHRV